MAYLKSADKKIKSESALSRTIEYIINPKKNFNISCENCFGKSYELIYQFKETLKLYMTRGNILAHHYIQSFSPDDNVTPEQAHQIAIDLMKKAAPNYQYIISTHIDKDHIHNHILINSVNLETRYKWHDNKNTINHMRNINDELCKKNNLSIINESETKGLDQTTYQLGIKGNSWKINLVKDLDEAVLNCQSKIEFIDFLNKRDYSVQYKDVNNYNNRAVNSTILKVCCAVMR